MGQLTGTMLFLRITMIILCFWKNQSQEWEKRFLTLGQEIAKTFNLSNCWVCGSPGGAEDWPWVAQPVQPKWWVSPLSIVHKETGFWA